VGTEGVFDVLIQAAGLKTTSEPSEVDVGGLFAVVCCKRGVFWLLGKDRVELNGEKPRNLMNVVEGLEGVKGTLEARW
jgi:hypothetical protein